MKSSLCLLEQFSHDQRFFLSLFRKLHALEMSKVSVLFACAMKVNKIALLLTLLRIIAYSQ